MRYLSILILSILCVNLSSAQKDINYFLPDSIAYNPSIPTPESVIGHQVGEWHVTHDKLIYYMQALAQASDRITITETGRTYEDRPQLLLTITHPSNHSKIEEIQRAHKALTQPNSKERANISNMPAVVWMGFSIHGNEPSGSNASMLTAYFLAAAEGQAHEEKLKHTVILLDPSFNPDGLHRFATWANMHKSETLVTDPNDREFNEVWPGGRTNHYWFDMNRDWLPTQLVESQNRIAQFHAWKPNILTDHHEMGTNSTFFFQPGVPERTHPLTPGKNQALTAKIGQYHAKYLDRIGSLYYSKEDFDDFYYGKGSTFPDVQGAIGILFEQASSRGHAQESVNGIISFPFTIKNQFTATLSTWEAAYEMREELLSYQQSFHQEAMQIAASSATKAWVLKDQDASKLYEFAAMLQRHEIDIFHLSSDIKGFPKEKSLIIPAEQYQHLLIKAIFDVRTSFKDSLFYDVSAFNMAMSFNLDQTELSSKEYSSKLLGKPVMPTDRPESRIVGGETHYAYLMEWTDFYAPKALYEIQEQGIQTKVLTAEVILPDGTTIAPGSILIPVKQQPFGSKELFGRLEHAASGTGVTIHSLASGNTQGVNLGSPTMEALSPQKIAMLVGEGISPYDAGEIWFLLDQRYQMPITKIDMKDLGGSDLSRYNTIILPNGWGYSRSGILSQKLKSWVQDGGTLIAYKNAAKWLSEAKLTKVKFKEIKGDTLGYAAYEDLNNAKGAQVIGGAIFEVELDLSHPLSYGFNDSNMPIFRNSTLFMEKSKNIYANPVRYGKKPLLNGYISKENSALLENTAAVSINQLGRGKIISFTDNTNFRAFWFGTNRLLMNAIFFGNIISNAAAE